jgi:acyl dehydratase
MISSDWNPIHADAEFAASTRFGERVVHGALGIALVTGFMHQLGIFETTAVAMLSLQDWRFKAPICIGQTVRLRLTIAEMDEGQSPRVGRLTRRLELISGDGRILQDGLSDMLILKRDHALHGQSTR